eukprot:TRINITY_DN20716_c0_g1_i1.p1 TRINITY_DN20716_c0_g1~~TRINITY_DN20716_c0_g1_i1.p1  ORF type:complete len:457 (+),score=107.30 TRINITY_DN20716_c0_g1_i1:160-1530(+)
MATLMPLPVGGGYIPSPTPVGGDVTARQSISRSVIYSSAPEEMSIGAVSSKKAPAPSFAYPGEVPPPQPLLSPRGGSIMSPAGTARNHQNEFTHPRVGNPQELEVRHTQGDDPIRHAAELIVSRSLGKPQIGQSALVPQAVASAECLAKNAVPAGRSDVLEECMITPRHERRLSSPVRQPSTAVVASDPVVEAAERIVESQMQTSLIPPTTAVQQELAIESARDVAASAHLNAKISELETEDLLSRLVKRHNNEREQKDRAISRLTSKVVELEEMLQARNNENLELEEKIKTLLDVHGEKVLALQEQVTVLKAGQHTTTAHNIVTAKETELQEAKKKLALKARQLSDMMIQLREVERKLDKSTLEHKPIRQALELAGHRYKEAEDARRALEESSISQADEILLLRAEIASLRAAHQTAVIGKEQCGRIGLKTDLKHRFLLNVRYKHFVCLVFLTVI